MGRNTHPMDPTPLQTQLLSPNTIIREAQGRVSGHDPLDRVISPFYITQWTTRPLQDAVAPLSMTRATFSRYYPLVSPKVIVDFQQGDKTRHWLPDEKRRWCHAQGFVYVPMLLTDRLTVDQCKHRLQAETDALRGLPTRAGWHSPDLVPVEPPEPVVPTQDDHIARLLALPEVVVGLTTIVDNRLSKLPIRKGPGRPKLHSQAKAMAELTHTLSLELASGELPLTEEGVLAWIAARQ